MKMIGGKENQEMSRIERIYKYRETEEEKAAQKAKEQENLGKELIKKVKGYEPRIKELIETANACIENGIEINAYGNSLDSYEDKYEKGTFVTNSITHRLGFVRPTKRFEAIKELGINAGGACGNWDFRTDGVKVYSLNNADKKAKSKPSVEHMKLFIGWFDYFETAFYDYVDGIVESTLQGDMNEKKNPNT